VMRRIVDGAIPVCAAIAAIPTALGLMPLPPSMLAFTGMAIARTWMATLAVSFTLISVGVAISKQRLDAAFWLEAIPFSYVGTIFALHVVALFAVNGTSAWANGWWELGIVCYCYARFSELFLALRRSRRRQ
jgi:hypothetical protein